MTITEQNRRQPALTLAEPALVALTGGNPAGLVGFPAGVLRRVTGPSVAGFLADMDAWRSALRAEGDTETGSTSVGSGQWRA